jgi:hypothetical protein
VRYECLKIIRHNEDGIGIGKQGSTCTWDNGNTWDNGDTWDTS